MKKIYEIIDKGIILIGIIISSFLLGTGIVNRDMYSLIGSYLVYLYIVKN